MIFDIKIFVRFIGIVIVTLTFTFLFNNFLNFWSGWPGVDNLFKNYGWFGFGYLQEQLQSDELVKSWIQFFSYVFIFSLTSCNFLMFLSTKISLQFSSANLFETASPCPCAAPVINAIFLSNLIYYPFSII